MISQLSFFQRDIDLSKSQWWSIDKLEEFQNERLKDIIKYAYNIIPGYQRKFDEAKVKPKDIRTKDDLYKLPIITREELQNNKDFINEKLISDILYTGGSTGTSLKYYESKDSGKIRWDSHLRGWFWNGYIPGKKLAVIASAQGVVEESNTINIIGDLTTENLKKNVEKLLEFKPQHLRGYVGSLYILAKYCLDNNIKLDSIESVNPISENLYDYQRKAMQKAFKCEVFEEYCCNDGGACAWECEAHEGLHYFMERSIIENVNGEMVVTDLWNKAMPFIRYRVGDTATWVEKECECGRKSKIIREINGRTEDYVITPEGNKILRFDYIFKDTINVVEAQVVQKKLGEIIIRVVRRGDYKEKDENCIRREVHDKISPNLKVIFEYPLSIEREKTGKFRAVKSYIK